MKEKLDILYLRLSNLLELYLNHPVGKRDVFKAMFRTGVVSKHLRGEIYTLITDLEVTMGVRIEKRNPSQMLVDAYHILHKATAGLATEKKTITFKGRYVPNQINPIFKSILERTEPDIRSLDITLIPICSISDGKNKLEWSDIDCMVVLPQNIMTESGIQLLQGVIRKLVASFSVYDPLQDHGIFIITQMHMDYYVQSRMPLVVLNTGYSWPVHRDTLEISVADSTKSDRCILRDIIYTEVIKKEFNVPLNLSEFRLLLHRVFLLPSLYYQAKGEYIYKPYAIARISKELKHIDWTFMHKACEIYNNWNIQRSYRKIFKITLFRIMPYLLPMLIKYYYSKNNYSKYMYDCSEEILTGYRVACNTIYPEL